MKCAGAAAMEGAEAKKALVRQPFKALVRHSH